MTANQQKHTDHRKVAIICAAMTLGMLGMSFAAVPLYQIFCQVTGYGGTTQKADDTTGVVLNKKITIRFDANISNDLDWQFAPVEREVTLRIGEKGQTSYVAKNTGNMASFGTASFNVSPPQAGVYFNKIECFCFTEQELKPGQEVDMPVVFFVDPEIADDPLLKDTTTITLSYTFFPDEEAEQRVSSTDSGSEKTKSKL